VLGVDPRADPAEIRAAYRTLAREHHPDVDGGSSAHMAVLNEAWSVLGSPDMRAHDDLELGLPPPVAVAPPPASVRPPAVSRWQRGEPDSTVLDFGRYAGWSLRDLARHGPDFLRWLERVPIGIRHRAEITKFLPPTPVPETVNHGGGSAGRRRRFALW
jgi:curved DNA-binding protein CbpA